MVKFFGNYNKEANRKDNALKYAYMSVPETIKLLNSRKEGLTYKEIEKRKKIYGLNEITHTDKINLFRILANQIINPLVLLLLVAALVTYYTGELSETILISIIIILNAWLGFSQEFRAEKIVEKLKEIASPRATVIRAVLNERYRKKTYKQTIQEIDAKEIVPGDIIVLEPGKIVPADARIIESRGLEISEAILTGESMPVRKEQEPVNKRTKSIGDMYSMVFSGTYVTKGYGKAIVVETGNRTQLGGIASMTTKIEREIPLQKKIKELTKQLSLIIIAIVAMIFIIGSIEGKRTIEMFKIAVGLGVAALPEGLPAIVTITLAIGLKVLAEKKAIIKSLMSAETLGRTSVICVDKTGTLTKNEMTVTDVYVYGKNITVTGTGYSLNGRFITQNNERNYDLEQLLLTGYYCNNASYYDGNFSGDPTEIALKVAALKYFKGRGLTIPKRDIVNSREFESKRMLMSTVHLMKNEYIQYTKGALDKVIKACNRILDNGKVRKITKRDIDNIKAIHNKFADKALRVLGFAYKPLKKTDIEEKEMIFIGLQGMLDPPREGVKEAIETAKEAGIVVKMITGDFKKTAISVGRLIGITGEALTGEEIDKMSDKELSKKLETVNIFARVSPKNKLRLVNLLEKKYIVAMTGDGVNDAPALKKASIGISVKGASDVTKEAADMLLLEEHFNAIVTAIEQGRTIYENIQKFVIYLLSCNIAEVAVIFFAIVLDMPLPITIVQLLWINLVTDGPPAIMLGMDPPSKDVMKRRPRNKDEPILNKRNMVGILTVSMMMTISLLFLFNHYLPDLKKARTVVFTGFVMYEIARLQLIRNEYRQSWLSNKKLLLTMMFVIALQLIIVSAQPLRSLFGITSLRLNDYGLITVTGLAFYVTTSTINLLVKKVHKRMQK